MSSVTFSTTVGGDGSTVTDDDDATTGLRNGGWRTRFVPALTQEVAVAANAVASATAALSSKNAAATSASNAATSASNASTSATNAASSATAAADSYDSFDDRYLGAKTSDPTVDNDGNALLTGALYWNSATGVFKVWSGSAWITNITSNQFGTNVATFLATPTSANLAAALTDETGTGANVFATSPTLVTPVLGVATGTSFQGIIGNVTPAAGTFTTLTSTGNATLGDAEASDTHAIKGATTLLANSASAALTVTQTGAGNAFVVEDSASVDATSFIIDQFGVVLVGPTTFRNNFLNAAANTKVQVEGIDFNTSSLSIVRNGSAVAGALPILILGRTNGATVGSNTVVTSGMGLGGLSFQGSDGTELVEAALITAEVDGTPGANDMPGRLVFSTTADGASTPTERLRIDSTGNVGIGGAPSAGAKVEISGTYPSSGTVSRVIRANGTIPSTTTGTARIFGTEATAQATAYNISSLQHYYATQNTFSGGATVSNQYVFLAESTLTGATNNYGFYGAIASGTGRYNLYMAGTADNYLAGSLSVGTVNKLGTITNYGALGMVCGSGDLTANKSLKFYIDGVLYGGIYSPNGKSLAFQAGASTLSDAMVIDQSSNVGIGTASPNASAILDVQSTTKGVRMPNMTTTQKNAIASPAAGLMVFDTTLAKLCVYSGAAWQTITSI